MGYLAHCVKWEGPLHRLTMCTVISQNGMPYANVFMCRYYPEAMGSVDFFLDFFKEVFKLLPTKI
jgi:hypothetical protein